eukprot:TRINITY_DN4649_c0_g1_i2.p1 TRINITY_DN4649_c0_g1~~TRINITY_DN4649_c0_g1_i2.p1  ORF type:complete len:555 (-),score=153.10 TRINITY_DN4649_c0_g1_i2:51-1715(-)
MQYNSASRFKNLLFKPNALTGTKLLKWNSEWHFFKRAYEKPLLQLYAQTLQKREEEWKQLQKVTLKQQKKEEEKLVKKELTIEKTFARKRMLEWFQENKHSFKELKKLTEHPFEDFFMKYVRDNLDYSQHLDSIEEILDSEAPALEEAGLGPIPHTSEFWKPNPSSHESDQLRGRLEALKLKAQVVMSLKKKAGLPVEWVHGRLTTQINAIQKYISEDSQIVQLLKYQDIPNDVIQHMVRLYGLWIHKEFRLTGDWTQANISEPPPSLLAVTLTEETRDPHTEKVSQQHEWDLSPPRIQALSSTSLNPAKDLTLSAILAKKKQLKFPSPVASLTDEEPIEFITVQFDEEEFKHERRKDLMESKVKMRVKLSAFKLSPLVTARLVALVGSRYDPETGILTIVGDKHNTRHRNWMYVKILFQELLQQAHMIDPRFVPIEDLERSAAETRPRDTTPPPYEAVDEDGIWRNYVKFVDGYQLGEYDLAQRWMDLTEGGGGVAGRKGTNQGSEDDDEGKTKYVVFRMGALPDPKEDAFVSSSNVLSSLKYKRSDVMSRSL